MQGASPRGARVARGFRKRGAPCDTLGVQSHIGLTGDGTVGALVSRQERALARLPRWRGADGLQAGRHRVRRRTTKALPTDAKLRDGIIANYARGLSRDHVLSYPQLRDVLAWGMCDHLHLAQRLTPREDRTRQRATPYDAEYRPKALYGVIRDAFAAAPAR